MDKSFERALDNLTRYGNSFGAPSKTRSHWTRDLDFHIKDARRQPVHYLWFVGDFASYDARAREATCAAARVFHQAGLDFGILYDGESNSGNDIGLAGQEGLFEKLRGKNLRSFAGARFEEILTTDPHSFQALKYDYFDPRRAKPVWHHSQILADLVESGTVNVRHHSRLAVTYHDPCYLGRYSGIFGAPRRLIAALGLKLVEMPRNRTYAYCCGAAGGRIWMDDPPAIPDHPALARVREAAMLQHVHILAVACPKDLVMFQDALRATGLEGKLAIKELSQLVEEAIG
jgi:Fe-S oxidoreductase